VPRHPERFDKVAEWIAAHGEALVRRSRPLSPRAPGARAPVILVDTIGELSSVWGLADVAFVGGSLTPGRGGQNMMEPAAFGVSVMFGPYTENFRETVDHMLARGAARRVADAADLATALVDDLDDPEAAAQRGAAGRAYVLAQNGASDRTLAELDRLVELTAGEKTA
jgi:3-deoxy-D-manno-octulosonic-acid transferase